MNVIVIDTETTDLGAQRDREDAIVQVGAVAVRMGDIVDEFGSLCWPGERYFAGGRAERALEVSRISMEDLRRAPPDVAVADQLRIWIETHLPAMITAYNVPFDSPFLEAPPWELHRIGIEWTTCIMQHTSAYLGEMGLNRRHPYYGNWKWVRLANACHRMNVELTRAHDAVADARAAAEIMIRTGLYDQIRGENDGSKD